jgi:prevent-host-death family protein
MFEHWQFQEAKNKLSEVINRALKLGAQVITRRGEKVAVILSYDDYQKLQKPQTSLTAFFHNSPIKNLDLMNNNLRVGITERK